MEWNLFYANQVNQVTLWPLKLIDLRIAESNKKGKEIKHRFGVEKLVGKQI